MNSTQEIVMATINQNLYGYWKMTAMRFLKTDGEWESETVFGGSSVFTESGQINTFTRTSEIPFGYSGTFVIKGNDLLITPEVCSITSQEGHLIIRTVKELGAESLTLAMTDEATGRKYEIDFRLLDRSFQN
jgi:hypothetical protein